MDSLWRKIQGLIVLSLLVSSFSACKNNDVESQYVTLGTKLADALINASSYEHDNPQVVIRKLEKFDSLLEHWQLSLALAQIDAQYISAGLNGNTTDSKNFLQKLNQHALIINELEKKRQVFLRNARLRISFSEQATTEVGDLLDNVPDYLAARDNLAVLALMVNAEKKLLYALTENPDNLGARILTHRISKREKKLLQAIAKSNEKNYLAHIDRAQKAATIGAWELAELEFTNAFKYAHLFPRGYKRSFYLRAASAQLKLITERYNAFLASRSDQLLNLSAQLYEVNTVQLVHELARGEEQGTQVFTQIKKNISMAKSLNSVALASQYNQLELRLQKILDLDSYKTQINKDFLQADKAIAIEPAHALDLLLSLAEIEPNYPHLQEAIDRALKQVQEGASE